jgi:hypothetical protein
VIALLARHGLHPLLTHFRPSSELERAPELVSGVSHEEAVIHGGVQDHPQGRVHEPNSVARVRFQLPREERLQPAPLEVAHAGPAEGRAQMKTELLIVAFECRGLEMRPATPVRNVLGERDRGR